MHFPGDSTWRVSSGRGDTFTLYVRDALGISTPTADSIPPLTPPVPRLPGVTLPDTFGAAWDRWWAQSVSAGAEDVPGRWPVGLPQQLRPAYDEWVTHKDYDGRTNLSEVLQEIVAQLSGELGHVPVFDLEIVEVPVQGQFWRRLSTNSVMVSEELMASRNLIAPLESVLRELAR
ncbi:hypothetical protein OG205_09125 [Lentzea sp. NBC_00516]|uniref:hypothetical protein n=1 Tax=Lentzea sp. NBC_00516 TaxID=2903582 RepID=UPI002E815B8B|nr:hypothetical protein [Lentzea sp. NBC_00516]WUD27138.1 hypothetical protein OG205_09125 [Lentzea sp. NBC_00516]